ncbi:MAG: hypothetical protein VX768_03865 [Planctomycetota bacterium]|nr:hypothetical protein [Planctomycetota bacterium]
MNVARRDFLSVSAAATLPISEWQRDTKPIRSTAPPRPRVAVVMTVMTYRSHAHVILENFLHPYMFNGRKTDPGVEVASFYVDQFPKGDMARQVSKDFGIPVYDTIDGAICLGGKAPAVDAVLSIGEHGDYPYDELGRHQYPRKRFFDEIIQAVRKGSHGLPIFNDKHLSYRWDWSREMYETARKHQCPLMAGSSVPLAQRIPKLELPKGAPIEEAISIHGGGVESYDFHGLEVLQSMVENRQGQETGVASVQFLDSEALAKKIETGEISRKLLDAALQAVAPDHRWKQEELLAGAHGILLQYRDGFRAACLGIRQVTPTRWLFACQLPGEAAPRSCRFYVGPWDNRNLFKALSHAIQTHFRQHSAPYPVERTLLTSGIVNTVMDSRHAAGKRLDTPHLAISYPGSQFREMREMGDTWKHLKPGLPQPKGLYRQFGS